VNFVMKFVSDLIDVIDKKILIHKIIILLF